MGATNSWFNQGRRAPISVVHWRSRKLPRKAGSPQLVETYAASSAVVEMAWIKALWESMTWSDFNLLTQRRDSNRDNGKPSMPFVVRDQNPAWNDPESTLVMDSKGLYDSLDNELPQDDKKSAVIMPIVEEILRKCNGRSRWIPHNYNPSDGLTKLRGAHLQPMMDLLQAGMYHLKAEEAQIKDRKQENEQYGHVSRKNSLANRGVLYPRLRAVLVRFPIRTS